VLTELRTGKEKPFRFPKKVEACGGDGSIERVPGTAAWRCVSKDSFVLQVRKLQHFVSRKALDIDGLGKETVELLLEHGRIQTPVDLFTLKKGDLDGLPGFKDKAIGNLLQGIENARTTTLARLVFSLSIDQVGEETARDLAQHFGAIDELRNASQEELEAIEGVGPIVAQSICVWFAEAQHATLVDNLLRHITLTKGDIDNSRGVALQGQSVVITGTLPTLGREEAKELVRSVGGKVASSVSNKTSFVVVGRDPGSKADTAQKLNIPCIDEATFLKRIGR
jgi:DNA ligase (NAD+)